LWSGFVSQRHGVLVNELIGFGHISEQDCHLSYPRPGASRSVVGGAANLVVVGSGGGAGAAQPTIDVKSLHAKIGELTLENDFLEGALSKAGLLSAKR
jgi:hypothetical protein